MTKEEQVNKQIESEIETFQNSIYKGSIAIPKNVFVLLKRGYMVLAPQYHKVFANKIKVVVSKDISGLTISDLRDVITIIVNTPLERLYDTFEEAIESQVRIDKFVLSYNTATDDFINKLKMKRETLMNLSGARNDGMRVVPLNGQA